MSTLRSGSHRASTESFIGAFAADVRYYLSLTPPQLPSRYFYDEVGSALFETICRLPWYSITRAEMRLLAAHGAEIFERLPSLRNVIELGPGSGEKLRIVLESASRRSPLDVHLVDVSPSALALATQTLGTLDGVHIVTHRAPYDAGLRGATTRVAGRTLVMFLGSNIGNYDPPGAVAFLHNIRASLMPGDGLLLGVDLVKAEDRLLLAYDDPLGVTAAFNRNLLVRINRELGGKIDLGEFAHRALWNEKESRVEMHLVARSDQAMQIPRAHVDLRMRAGESIWTESSYKYQAEGVDGLLRSCGFTRVVQWVDPDDCFALTLAQAA